LDPLSPEEIVAEEALRGDLIAPGRPDLILAVVDATNIERNLFLVSEVLDQATHGGCLEHDRFCEYSGALFSMWSDYQPSQSAPVIPVSAGTSEGLD